MTLENMEKKLHSVHTSFFYVFPLPCATDFGGVRPTVVAGRRPKLTTRMTAVLCGLPARPGRLNA
jgi:hypothetical protein